jgi:Fe2+ transport system protein FeoA
MKCSFCGHEFREEEARRGCVGCPVSGGCGKLRCPNCGFEMPAPAPKVLSGIGRMLSHVLPKRRVDAVKGTLSMTLADLKTGEGAVVTDIDRTDPKRMKRLLALGVLPGERVRIIQTYPTYVFSIGSTKMAVDRKTAGAITIVAAAAD